MNDFWAVVSFTFKNKLRSKTFIITTIIFVILLSALIHLPMMIDFFTSKSEQQFRIGIANANDSIVPSFIEYLSAEDNSIELIVFDDHGSQAANLDHARELVEQDQIEAYIEVKLDETSAVPVTTYYGEKEPRSSISSQLTRAMERVKMDLVITEIGLTAEQLERIHAPVQLKSVAIEDGEVVEDEGRSPIAYILVYALIILIFMIVTMYGNLVATEITAEKSSRVMEILVSSVPPITQMFGKIFGLFLLSSFQIGVFAIAIAINLLLPYNLEILSQFDLHLSDVDMMLILYFVLFYVLAFLLYSTVFAAIGSIVSRTEELGQTLMPMTFLVLAGFYIALFGISIPNAAFIVGSSYFPFFTPMVMFLRIGLGEYAWWEIPLSILIMIASIILFCWIAAKIYRIGVLLYGKRPTIKELRKAMKAFKA